MRIALIAFCFTVCASAAIAQTRSEDKKPGDSPQSTGRTVLPDDNKGQLQPQGWTGPITTGSGGTPAASPQGQSPPGMQAAPDGSSKGVVDPKKSNAKSKPRRREPAPSPLIVWMRPRDCRRS